MAVFFFSSRRRHTRLVSDWSSDVCSSDLGKIVQAVAEEIHGSESAEDGQGQGEAWNDGGGDVSEEEENDQDHKANCEHEGKLDVVNRFADGFRAVVEDIQ